MRHKSKLVDTDTELDYFVNPTLQELDTIESGHVRFIADDTTKQVYVCDGYNKTHEDMLYDLSMLISSEGSKYLQGIVMWEGGKYLLRKTINVEYYMYRVQHGGNKELVDVVDKIINTDWTWIENYSIKNVGSHMEELRSNWEGIKQNLKIKNSTTIVNKLLKLAELLVESKFYDADKYTEYFVNPDILELDSLEAYSIRFIIDNKYKKVYAWDGQKRLHSQALEFLKLKIDGVELAGVAKKRGGKYVMIESVMEDEILFMLDNFDQTSEEYKDVDNILNKIDWSWVDYYIVVSVYLNELRNKFNAEVRKRR